jgi:lysophospholipase L1-like esterase
MTAAAAILIVALGDSTTAGTPFFKSPVEAAPNGSGDATAPFAYRMAQAHPDWTVLNRGVNGERSDQIAARFDRDVLAAHPRFVVILAGVNDVYQGRSAESVTAQLRLMYDKARAAKIPVIAGSIVPYNTATPDQNQRMHAINDWIRAEAARDPNITFVDTRKAAARPDNIDLLASSPDGLHPGIDGYHRMGDVIAAAISQAMKGNEEQ